MSQMKLFGNSRTAARVAGRRKAGEASQQSVDAPKEQVKKQKVKKPLKVLAIWLTVILCLEGLYFFCCYTQNAFVSKWRTIYVQTAMSTMRHQWMATYLLPESVVNDVMQKRAEANERLGDKESSWGKTETDASSTEPVQPAEPGIKPIDTTVTEMETETLSPEDEQALAKEAFYELFWELDQTTMEAYVEQNPSVLDNGWENININEAGLDDNGTSIMTTMGEQVLAINAKEEILLVRVEGSGYRGVLAIAKDPARLNVENSSGVGQFGQLTGTIAEAHNGILATTCSGFIDIDNQGNWGNGNGGLIAGYAMSNGHGYGTHYVSNPNFQYYRLEIHTDNLIYIKKVDKEVSEDCRDATEFQPPIIIDGEVLESDYWVELNPRVCIGQSDKYEMLLLAIEGRIYTEGILGTDVNECAKILQRHNAVQAMNVDGGTSAMMWYDGEYVIRGSNPQTRYTGSRPVPNAFVYHRVEEE